MPSTSSTSLAALARQKQKCERTPPKHPQGNLLRELQSNETGPENPKNWSGAYKWWCAVVVAATCFTVALDSAAITANIAGPAEEFGVREEVATCWLSPLSCQASVLVKWRWRLFPRS
jgi:hypothetical protein